MNLILFSEDELGRPLPRRDARTIHLLKVLHKTAGDTFNAGVSGGRCGTARITGIGEDGALLFSLNADRPPPAKAPLRLAAGFPRPVQLRRLLRDLATMGLARIDLLETDLGDPNYRKTTLLTDGGAEAALQEGIIQARDTILPRLTLFKSLDAWLLERGAEGTAPRVLRAACDNVAPEGDFAGQSGPFSGALLAVGPERGWSERERGALKGAGFARLSFGARPLRTESACLVACALASALCYKSAPESGG